MSGDVRAFGRTVVRTAKIAAAAFVAISAAAIKSATVIEGAQRKIQVGTGATGAALKGLENDFRKVFAGVPESAGTVGGAIANLNTIFGATGKPLQDLATKVLDVSRLLGGDGEQNALQFGRAMKQFGVDAQDSLGVLDTFFGVTQQSGITFERLTRDVREFGPVLSLANIGVQEGARLIGNLSKEGINFTRVSPALRQGFIKMAAEGKNVREELGVFIERIKNAKTAEEGATIASEVFGTEVARLVSVIQSGAFALDDQTDALDEHAGAIQTSLDATSLLSEEFGKLKNITTLALEPLGKAFLQVFRDDIAPVLEKFIVQVGETLPRSMIEAFKVMAALTSGIGPAFIGAFNAISITLKAVALAALGVAVGLRVLAQSRAINVFGIASEEAKQATVALNDVKAAFKAVGGSIVTDVEEIANAQKQSDAWADSINQVGIKFEAALVAQQATNEETKDVVEGVAMAAVEADKLKEPMEGFTNTIEIAGRTIAVDINGNLKESLRILQEIRIETDQAATAGGFG